MRNDKERGESDFQRFIERQSRVIDSWPDWKKNVLGRIDELDKRVEGKDEDMVG